MILIIFVLLFDGVKSPSCQAFQNRYLLLLRRRMRHQDQKSTRCLMDKDDKVRTLFLFLTNTNLVRDGKLLLTMNYVLVSCTWFISYNQVQYIIILNRDFNEI